MKRILAAAAALLLAIFLVYALATRPPAPSPQNEPQSFDLPPGWKPLQEPMLQHMMEVEGIDAGEEGEHELVVRREGDMVHVTLSEAFLEEIGREALARLTLAERETVMSPARYIRFLNDLHGLLAGPGGHDHHDHDHSADG